MDKKNLQVMLIGRPTDEDWINVKRRALITVYGDHEYFVPPGSDWKHRILAARHSPIRYLRYSFLCKWIPSNIAVHFCRHVHAQPYCSSLRNDRQGKIDGDAARRDTPINMILDVNAEELMVMANKRLCMKSAEKTREIMQEMCRLAQEATPELEGLLVPMCEWCGVCREMHPCGKKYEESGGSIRLMGMEGWKKDE
jgi:hypothetical protein